MIFSLLFITRSERVDWINYSVLARSFFCRHSKANIQRSEIYILSSVDLEADSSSIDGTACTSDEIQQAVQCLSNECSGLQGIQLAFCGGLRYTTQKNLS